MESVIICNYEYDKKVSFALQQNHVQLIKYLSIKNTSDEKITNLRVQISSNPSFSETNVIRLEELHPDEVVELRPNIILSADYLSNLDESMTGHIEIKIISNENVLYQNYLSIDILSFDSWPGATVLPEIISSFVTPNRPFVMEIIKQASQIMEKNTNSNAMDGYQSGDPNRVLAQISAIFSAIQSQNLAYANPPASFETQGQKVRFPDLIKEHKLATCLDSTLLFAACAEAIGIHSLIIFFKGHALPGFWLREYASSESFQDDKGLLTKSIASGINDMVLVESTYVTQKDTSFTKAVQSAHNSISKPDYFEFFVDIRRSRIGQIKPISIKHFSGAKIQATLQMEEPVKINDNFTFEKVEIIPENDTTNQTNLDKVTYWQNKLIDMSLRNNLLNYRIYTQGIPVLSSSIDQIEDTLAMGKKVFIHSLPNELRQQIRDFGEQKEILHSQILTEDMKNDRLRSTLTNEKLEKELVKLYRRAKNTLEETGANSLFIALGFLKWFEPKSYSKERFAPILLLPVDLVRMSAKKGYYIRARDEDIHINISLIEYLKQNFGIDASRLYNIPKDDHGVDVRKILTTMRRIIMQMKNWDVQEVASIGIFSFAKFVMWNDLVHYSNALKENTIVKSLIEGNYASEPSSSMTEMLTTGKDEDIKIYAPLSSDSTQREAILAAGDGNSFVLHGPPGSGKSQTITNMISHTLASGKTVLFVAEKMAALSVVQKRLADIGLADFCLEVYSNKGQKKDILRQLENSFEAQHQTKGTDWDAKFEEVKMLKKDLNQYARELHQPTAIGQSIYEMIETYSGLEKPATMIDVNRKQAIEMDEVTLKRTKTLIEKLTIAADTCGHIADNPWLGIQQTNYSLQLYDRVKSELTTMKSKVTELRKLDNYFAQQGIEDSTKNYHYYVFLYELMDFLENVPNANMNFIAEDTFDQRATEIKSVINLGREKKQATEKIEDRFDTAIFKLDTEQTLKDLRLAKNSWFLRKKLGQNKIIKRLKQYLKATDKIHVDELEPIIQSIKKVHEKQKKIEQCGDILAKSFPDYWKNAMGEWDEVEKALKWMQDIRTLILKYNASSDYLKMMTEHLLTNKEIINTPKLQEHITEYRNVFKEIDNHWANLESQLLTKDFHEPAQPNWIDFTKEKVAALTIKLPQLKDNCHLSHVIQEADAFGLEYVTKGYLEGKLENTALLPSFLYGLYRIRIDEEISKSDYLAQFSRGNFERKIEQFHTLDDEISELTKLEVYVKLMNHVPNLINHVMQSSEPGILLKAIKSKGRGIAIRQLFERIQNLLPKIKPCMLMSPISVAQYLDPSFPKFDLVIFDEASQLPTSEAIGAMGRGKNVIVVGDPKQLPPTSFFNAQQKDDETDFEVQDLESVLDDCLAVRMPQKHLKWHYRSEHESLISFSNNHFYDNNLITFPSIDDIHSRVSFENVQGVYDRGKTKHNKIEAEAIVNEIFTRLSNPLKQQESIGVVTFNQVQQTLIEDLIDERLKEDASLEKYFTDQVQEPVFVKNLENVQGDERDLILFSVGYGPDKTGHMTLNFGPLNRDGGWRRLNVAISRAKKEMIIIASMEPDQINLSRTKAEGVHSLRAFMEFAKRGNEPLLYENRTKNKNMHSQVIIPKIKKALENQGYRVQADVGSSEFKVDLAVIDKNKDNVYIAGIQLDGYRYAHRNTTRDRDRLSELILGRLGWNIIKVWSIEWWHNEEKQIENILFQIQTFENEALADRTEQEKIIKKQTKQASIQEKIDSLLVKEGPNEKKAAIFEPVELETVEVPNDFFYTLEGLPTIRKQIEKIVDQEAPVSFSRLSKAIIEAWGFSRSGAKLESVIQDSLNSMMVYESIEEKAKFLWKDGNQFETYAEFRRPDQYRRPLEDISKVEFANGIQEIMQTALRLPKADLIREISKQLGYNRATGKTEMFVEEGIGFSKEKGTISESKEGVIVNLN